MKGGENEIERNKRKMAGADSQRSPTRTLRSMRCLYRFVLLAKRGLLPQEGSGGWRTAIQSKLDVAMKLLSGLIALAVGFWEWCGDYSGFGAELVKGIPDAIKALIVGEPVWLFVLLLMISQGQPLSIQYLLYVLWCMHFVIIALLAFTVRYIQGR